MNLEAFIVSVPAAACLLNFQVFLDSDVPHSIGCELRIDHPNYNTTYSLLWYLGNDPAAARKQKVASSTLWTLETYPMKTWKNYPMKEPSFAEPSHIYIYNYIYIYIVCLFSKHCSIASQHNNWCSKRYKWMGNPTVPTGSPPCPRCAPVVRQGRSGWGPLRSPWNI